MRVEDFIKQHNHINYCEAIIYPNGQIDYSIPSHQQKLIEVSKLSIDKLMEVMPLEAAPNEWLVDYTGCAITWYEFGFMPEKLTSSQIKTIQMLIKNGILSESFTGYKKFEKQICDLHRKEDIELLKYYANLRDKEIKFT